VAPRGVVEHLVTDKYIWIKQVNVERGQEACVGGAQIELVGLELKARRGGVWFRSVEARSLVE
jgi:hypothetical protein